MSFLFRKKALVLSLASCFAVSAQAGENVVDIMVLYTQDAVDYVVAGDIDAQIASYINYSNETFKRSNVNLKYRLVHKQLFNPRNISRYEKVNSSSLAAFAENSEVANLRKKYGADIVTLVNLREEVVKGNSVYYTCGIGYVPGGYNNTFYSNASANAYNLVGVECGNRTFLHESMHNAGAGHSKEQDDYNSESYRVDKSARGYGQYNRFATIMAYPHVFGSAKAVPYISNPAIYNCDNDSCGVHGSADAAKHLNKMGDKVANFMATKVVDTSTPTDDGTTSEPETPKTDTPETPKSKPNPKPKPKPISVCEKDSLDGNLLDDGDFNESGAWESYTQSESISTVYTTRDCGRDYIALVSNRNYFYSGAVQDITAKVESGVEYTLSAKMGLSGNYRSRSTGSLAIQVSDSRGTYYHYVANKSLAANTLSKLSGKFKIKSRGTIYSVRVLAYGPGAGTDFYLDEVLLKKVEQPKVKETPKPVISYVLDENFERGAGNWFGYGSYATNSWQYSTSGYRSLIAFNRSSQYSGPALNLHGIIEPSKRFKMQAKLRLGYSLKNTENVEVVLTYVNSNGYRKWETVSAKKVNKGQWYDIEGTFTAPAYNLRSTYMMIVGPSAGTEYYLDDVKVNRVQ
ncbi:carbohydrate binding domain-containing protein [Zooshikella marina]|uniref:carbohydrate binding domain-containing protein n=1 Tax=Zooshikella ganghwensis TaxID=202772 RepID=UPI001BAFC551|nr:carbohydrate binding domain-containing protein [Zooshikella ganghwensis]MBU2706258.1 carbohydrate binding domain-containing protein [Zooshikella ganghwensis]